MLIVSGLVLLVLVVSVVLTAGLVVALDEVSGRLRRRRHPDG